MDGTASVATIAEQIVVALQQNRVVTYFDLNASALLLYDYFLNLPDEIDLIWNSRWNAVKVTYLLNRCISFGNIAIGIYHQLGFDMSASICHRVYTITGWLITCGIATSELMLVYRTFALWGNEKRIGYALGLMFIGTRIASGIYLYKALRSMEFIPIGSLSPELRGCFPTKIDNIIYICWSIDLAYETVIMGLTFVKALQNFRRTSSSLLYMIFRDSTLSYITLFVSSLANVLVLLLGPVEYGYLLTGTQYMLHVVMSSHIIINIRRRARSGAILATNLVEIELEETQDSLARRSR